MCPWPTCIYHNFFLFFYCSFCGKLFFLQLICFIYSLPLFMQNFSWNHYNLCCLSEAKFSQSAFVDQMKFNLCLFHYCKSASFSNINVTTWNVFWDFINKEENYLWGWEAALQTKLCQLCARKSRHLWSAIPLFGRGEVLIFLIKHKVQTLWINNFLKWSKI